MHVIKRAVIKWLQTYGFEMRKAPPVSVEEIVQVLTILKLDRYLPKDEEEEKRWSMIQENSDSPVVKKDGS